MFKLECGSFCLSLMGVTAYELAKFDGLLIVAVSNDV